MSICSVQYASPIAFSLSRSAARRSMSAVGRGRTSAARRAEGAGKEGDGFGVRGVRRTRGQRGRVGPGAALERVARGHGRNRQTSSRLPRCELAGAIDNGLGGLVLRDLQEGIGLVVEGVQLLAAPLVFRAASADRRFVSIDSCQEPTRVKVCDGMCRACGIAGASEA